MISSDKSEGLFDRWKTHNDSCYVERENNKKNKNKQYKVKILMLKKKLKVL